MAEKNEIANALDKAFSKLGKKSEGDVLNMLPKPDSQSIGDGVIVWQWIVEDKVFIQSVLATRNHNQLGMEKDQYLVTVKMPESEDFSYAMFDETAKDIGQALLSAWNWQNVWKLHAADFLLETLSQEPCDMDPAVEPEVEPEVVEREEEYVKRPPQILPEPVTIIDAEQEFDA